MEVGIVVYKQAETIVLDEVQGVTGEGGRGEIVCECRVCGSSGWS